MNIDPNKIAVAGYSAGGLMALFAGGTQDRKEFDGNGGNPGVSTKISACVGFYPATNATANLMPDGSDAAAREAASPAKYIAAGFAPTILFHGLADTTIRPESSQRFLQLLLDAKIPAELHLFDGVPHAFEVNNPEFAKGAAQMADLFFDHNVLNPRTYPPFGGGGRGGARGGGGGRGGGAPGVRGQ